MKRNVWKLGLGMLGAVLIAANLPDIVRYVKISTM